MRVLSLIPAWFAEGTPGDLAASLLLEALSGGPPELTRCLVVVDGSPPAARAAERACEGARAGGSRCPELLILSENRGKGGAIVAGLRRVLGAPDPPDWIAVRDADGDHLLDDLPHLLREAAACGHPRDHILVIGARSNLDWPLTPRRASWERLSNAAIVDALAFRLARNGLAWDSRRLLGRVPDLQSGYKLYSRAAAEFFCERYETEAAACPDLELPRTGMEVVPFVLLALGGATIAETLRKTRRGQPVSSFAAVDAIRFYGRKIAWAVEHCDVPRIEALRMLDSAATHVELAADLVEAGALEVLRAWLAERWGLPYPAPIAGSAML